MSPLVWLAIVWGVLTGILIILLIYRSTLTMQEDSQLFLDEAESHMEKEQAELISKVNKINPLVKLLGATSGVMRDLLRLPRAQGNQKKLTRNLQGERRQHPFHVGREIVAMALANADRRRAIARADINVIITPAISPFFIQQHLPAIR